MEHYLSYKSYMQRCYGEVFYTIPINLHSGCPNRSLEGKGGCTFCPEHGGRARQIADANTVQEQIKKAVAFAKRRYHASSFALYFQAYTTTFDTLIRQKKLYEELVSCYPFKILYIGTRPDCVDEAVLDYLVAFQSSIEIVVELGVQSMHDATLKRINRGHDSHATRKAITRLHVRGIKVHAHLIIGLEHETPAMWKESLAELVDAGIDGIKFHNLHIIKGTQLAKTFEQNPFEMMDEYAYAEALIELLRHVPSHIPIIRIATDTPKKERIAPFWQMDKEQFRAYVVETMHHRGLTQGDALCPQTLSYPSLLPIPLKDGSFTFWNAKARDHYHPKSGAWTQAKWLFCEQSALQKRLQKGKVRILDVGFGMGYNALEALYCAKRCGGFVEIIAIDHDRIVIKQTLEYASDALHVTLLKALDEKGAFHDTFGSVRFENAHIAYTLRFIKEAVEIIFLDPFEQTKAFLEDKTMQQLHHLLQKEGILVVSCASNSTFFALEQTGFLPKKIKKEGNDIKGIVATRL